MYFGRYVAADADESGRLYVCYDLLYFLFFLRRYHDAFDGTRGCAGFDCLGADNTFIHCRRSWHGSSKPVRMGAMGAKTKRRHCYHSWRLYCGLYLLSKPLL